MRLREIAGRNLQPRAAIEDGRTRGYRRKQLVLDVSRLIAWASNLLDAGGADLTAVITCATNGRRERYI